MALVTCHCTIVCKLKHVCRVCFLGLLRGAYTGWFQSEGSGFEVQGHQRCQKEVSYQLAFSCVDG